jgi:hypothetical protein
MTLSNPADTRPAVEQAFNAGDLDGLVGLYETDAGMVSRTAPLWRGSTQSASSGEAFSR